MVRKIQRFIRARALARKQNKEVVNPFLESFKSKRPGETEEQQLQRFNTLVYRGQDIVELHEDATCSKCSSALAELLCDECGDKVVFCKQCFVKQHSHGTRRRHNPKTIVYTHKQSLNGTLRSSFK